MPTYEYKCPKCDTVFEVLQKMKDKPAAKCPQCGAKAERQLSGGHGIHFKGTGFYETDYKRAGEKKPAADGSGSGGSSAPISPSKVTGGSSSGSSPKSSGNSSGSSSSGSSE